MLICCPQVQYVLLNTYAYFEASWFSLEQNSCCSCRQAFIYFSRLHHHYLEVIVTGGVACLVAVLMNR